MRKLKSFAFAALALAAAVITGSALAVTVTDAKWGNMGAAPSIPGVATKLDNGGYTGFTLNFATTDNVSLKEIGAAGNGTVKITKITLVKRSNNNPASPTTVRLAQGDKTADGAVEFVSQSIVIYGSQYPGDSGNLWTQTQGYYVATFRSEVEFDVTQDIALKFLGDNGQDFSAGIRMMQPANSVLQNKAWSPAIEIVGDYTYNPLADTMFKNPLAGDLVIAAGTYGEITVSDPGLPGTHFDDVAAITPTYGSFDGLIGNPNWTYLLTSTVSGWFKIDALPTGSDATIYGYTRDGKTCSMRVAVTPEGKLKIGKGNGANVNEWATNRGGSVTTEIDVPVDTWFYLTVAGQRKPENPTGDSKMALTVFVNGVQEFAQENCFLNDGDSGSSNSFVIGAGVSAAGLYGNTTAVTDANMVKNWATNPELYGEVLNTATVSEDTKWSDIDWSRAIDDPSTANLVLTVENNATITFDGLYVYGTLKIVGDATFVAVDSIYEDGCWEKSLLTTIMPLSTTGTISFGALKEGFYGAFTQNANGISLRAQNKEVISINIAGGGGGGSGADSPDDNLVNGEDFYGIAPTLGDSWNNINKQWQSGGNQTITIDAPNAYDGAQTINRPTMSLSATGKNTWQCGPIANPFLRGYLDDGNGVTVEVHGVPYTKYDVIVYATSDNATIALAPITINGKQYTFKDGETKSGSDVWGVGQYATPEIGKNALRVNDCTGDTVTINATRTGGRATLCAVQVINKGEVVIKQDFSATITASTKFSEIAWDGGKTFADGQLNDVVIAVGDGTGEVEIEFDDPEMMLGKITVVSERPVKFKATAALPNVGQFISTGCTGGITYAWPVSTLATVAGGVTYAGGAGADDDPAAVSLAVADGSMTLKDATFYLGATHSDVQSTVNMVDATVYANDSSAAGVGGLGIGKADFNLSGATKLTTEKVILSQGGGGRTANLTLSDTAEIVVTGSTVEDSNKSSIMFGHYNGPSTFTLNDSAKFTAENAQVLVGKTSGDQTIDINGGVFTAKGIKTANNANGTNALNLNGGELKLGEFGISSYGATTIPVTVDGNAKITSTTAMPITQAITVNDGKTLTFDATDGDIVISGAVANNGTIKVVGGNVVFMNDVAGEGAITTEGQGKVFYGYTININDCGEFTVPSGIAPESVRLYRPDGTIVNTEIKDGKLVFEQEFYGKNAWLEYLFNGTLASTGRDTGALQFDGTHCFPGNEYVLNGEGETAGGIYAASAPWRNLTFPNEVTVVMYGKVMKTSNTCQIGIGSTTGGTKYTLFLASGDVTKEEVVLGYAYNNRKGNVEKHDILCRMTVPHAQTTEHLYAFTLKKVGNDTVINIYLDGELLQPYTFKNQTVTLGSGIQLGSIHGGIGDDQNWPVDFGFKRSTDVETDATLDFIRVYDVELSSKVLRAIAADYPYESPSGSFNRTLEGDTSWSATGAWTKVGDTEKYDEPDAGSSVTITPPVGTAVTLTSNLMDTKTFEAMTFNAGGKITVVKGYDAMGEIVVVGRTTVSTDTQISIDAMELGGAVSVAAGKTLTFDFSSLDLAKEFSSRSIRLTGTALLGDGAKVDAAGIKAVDNRTATIVYDEATQQYSLAITVDELPFVYENGVWTWGEQTVEDADLAANPTVTRCIKSDYAAALGVCNYTVEEGVTLKQTDASATGVITVNAGGTFDVNGIEDTALKVVLNGGSLVNTGAGVPVGKKQYVSISQTADSFVGGPNELAYVSAGYAANTLDLGGATLTKKDDNTFTLRTTTITNGTIAVTGGTLVLNTCTVAAGESVTLDIADGATVNIVGGFTKSGILNLTGAGTVICEGVAPTFDSLEGWTGTVWIKNVALPNWDLSQYGNGQSFIKLTGVTGNGPNNSTSVCASTVILEDVVGANGAITTYALTVDDGYSSQSYTFGKVTGTGTFRFHRDDATLPTHQYVFGEVSEFSGSIADIGNLKIVIGDGAGTAGAITVADGATIGCTLNAASIVFGRTVTINGAKKGKVVATGLTAAPQDVERVKVTMVDESGKVTRGRLSYQEDVGTLTLVNMDPLVLILK